MDMVSPHRKVPLPKLLAGCGDDGVKKVKNGNCLLNPESFYAEDP